MTGQVLALLGATLTLLAAAGVVRFPEVLARMHALTKASTLSVQLFRCSRAYCKGSISRFCRSKNCGVTRGLKFADVC